MTRTERRAAKPSPATGHRSMLRALLRPGAAARIRAPRHLPVSLLAAALLIFAVGVAPASADEPPTIKALAVCHGLTSSGPYPLQLFSTRASLCGDADPRGSETTWRIEYAASGAGSWQLAASGIIGSPCSAGESCLGAKCQKGCNLFDTVQYLIPDTAYDARLALANALGKDEATTEFTTLPIAPPDFDHIPPGFSESSFKATQQQAVGTTFSNWEATIQANGADTEYHFEYSLPEAGHQPAEGNPSWTPFASGTITVAEDFLHVKPKLSGLSPETSYYVRLAATNHCSPAEPAKQCLNSEVKSFETLTVKPTVPDIGPLTNVTAVSVHVGGQGFTGTYETHWHFEYAPAEPGGSAPPTASPSWVPVSGAEGVFPGGDEEVHKAVGDLIGLSSETTYYVRLFAENANGTATSSSLGFETPGAPAAETFAAHAIHGESMRALGSVFPHGSDTTYRVQYVTEAQFEESEWAEASLGPVFDAGSGVKSEQDGSFVGYETKLIGADLPGLQSGVTYRYRILASNQVGTAQGQARTLTVPIPGRTEEGTESSQPDPCPNQPLRTGPSAALPDCRTYEQLTPRDKEGAHEVFGYGGQTGSASAAVAPDGEHLVLYNGSTNWGSGPGAGQEPYFFTRTESGWQMTAATPQPEAGFNAYSAHLFGSELTHFAFQSAYPLSPQVECKAGPPGGPYPITTGPMPAATGCSWVAATPDFSTLILESADRTLAGHPTGTKTGSDLYQYSQGQFTQVNVDSAGKTIGTCGARIVHGAEATLGLQSTPHALSEDGSRVFFIDPCSNQIYLREAGVRTLDIGAYKFLAANADASEVLFESQGGAPHQLSLYSLQTESARPLLSLPGEVLPAGGLSVRNRETTVAPDLSAIYFRSKEALPGTGAPPLSPATGGNPENLYRYDLAAETLSFVVQNSAEITQRFSSASPDGRFYYWEAPNVAGLPSGDQSDPHPPNQVFRYDSDYGLVQCISCASPFNPEPHLVATYEVEAMREVANNGVPDYSVASADGNYVYFDTPSALLSSDVDGESPPDQRNYDENGIAVELNSPFFSRSSDVYQWRRSGVDGCDRLQGCLSLISSGQGGFLVLFLGTTESGRDVFFYGSESLVPSDRDTAGDVYDARIGGGTPPTPPRPVECEGDACAHPIPAPDDPTPASSTFQGAGNEHAQKPRCKKHHCRHKKHHVRHERNKGKHKHRAKHHRRGSVHS